MFSINRIAKTLQVNVLSMKRDCISIIEMTLPILNRIISKYFIPPLNSRLHTREYVLEP